MTMHHTGASHKKRTNERGQYWRGGDGSNHHSKQTSGALAQVVLLWAANKHQPNVGGTTAATAHSRDSGGGGERTLRQLRITNRFSSQQPMRMPSTRPVNAPFVAP